jgi:hypothetical protein
MATTGVLWGSGSPVTTQTAGSWTGATSATGANDSAFASWTSTGSGASATIRVEGHGAQSAIGATPASVDQVDVTVYGYVSNTSRIPTIAVQLTDSGTLIGSPQTMTATTTTTNSQTFTFTGVTWSNLANLGVRVSFTRAGVTQSATANVDAVGVNVTYAPAVPTPVTPTTRATTWNTLARVTNAGAVVEDFSGTPAIATSGSPVAVVSDYGNPTPSLKGTGSGDWWYFTDSRFQVIGDFDVTYDLNINPDGTPGRDIANFGFWLQINAGTIDNGFMLRAQTAANDGGWHVVSGGTHTQIAGSSFSGPRASGTSLWQLDGATWWRIRLVASGNVISVTISKLTGTPEADTTGSIDLTAYIDASHPTQGTFGQKADGAGTAIGHRWDNITLQGSATSTTWSVAERITTTRATTWNVAANTTSVTTSRATTWNTRATATTTRATTWVVRGSVATTRATTWNALARATATRSTTWTAAATASTARATTWVVRSAVTPTTRATTWSALAQVTTSRATTWNVASAATTTPVSTTRATTWAVLAQATAQRATTWATLATTTSIRATTWTAAARISTTRATTWTAREAITGTHSTTWATRATVAGSRSTTWAVCSTVTGTRATTWNTLATVAATRATHWSIAARDITVSAVLEASSRSAHLDAAARAAELDPSTRRAVLEAT